MGSTALTLAAKPLDVWQATVHAVAEGRTVSVLIVNTYAVDGEAAMKAWGASFAVRGCCAAGLYPPGVTLVLRDDGDATYIVWAANSLVSRADVQRVRGQAGLKDRVGQLLVELGVTRALWQHMMRVAQGHIMSLPPPLLSTPDKTAVPRYDTPSPAVDAAAHSLIDQLDLLSDSSFSSGYFM